MRQQAAIQLVRITIGRCSGRWYATAMFGTSRKACYRDSISSPHRQRVIQWVKSLDWHNGWKNAES
jgi:hypothetical protein